MAQEYHFQHYDIFSGLGQSQVTDIEQDRYGYMWFSTRGGGLSRFNGKEFTNFRKEDNLPANNVLSLEIDAQGLMYVGTPFGLAIYDGKKTIQVQNDSAPSYTVNSLINNEKGDVFAVYNVSKIGRLKGKKLTPLSKINAERPTFFSDMSGTPSGQLMVATYAGEILEIKDTLLVRRYRLPLGMVLRSILFDSKNNLWLGTDRGVFRTSIQNTDIELSALELITPEIVTEMTETAAGVVWMGLQAGVIRWTEGMLKHFNAQNGFTDAAILRLAEDREGNVWFATDGEGVYKYSNPQFTSLTTLSGLRSHSILSMVLTPDKQLWIGYFDGQMDIWDVKNNRSLPLPSYLKNESISHIARDNQGHIWVSVRSSNLYRISKNGHSKVYTLRTKRDFGKVEVLFMTAGAAGQMWISTTEGVALFENEQFIYFDRSNGLKNTYSRRVLKLSDHEIITSGQAGFNLIRNGQVVDFDYDASLADYRALSMAKREDGILAFGSFEDGLVIFDPKTKQKKYLSVKDKLCSNLIYNLLFDQKGRLWVGTERGIDRVTFDTHLRVREIRHFDQMDGFLAQETNANTALLTPDGDVWMGTIKGVAMYHENPKEINIEDLKVHFINIQIPFDTTNLAQYSTSKERWHNVYAGLTLPHNKNDLQIDFISINHSYPNVKYRYILEGMGGRWLGPTEQHTEVFSNLSPGSYTFKVQATLDGIHWGPISAYPFEIVAPFYKQGWFLLLMLGIVIALGVLAQRLYIQSRTRRVLAFEKLKQEAEAAVRIQIAQDFHDELGNRLAAIKIQSNVLKMLYSHSDPTQNKIVNEIEKHVSSLFSNTKDFIWSIDPESNKAQELALYIKDFIENLLNDSNIQFQSKIQINELTKDVTLPPGWSIQAIMIFKEALTNCVKHSMCKNIFFNATIDAQQVSFELIDDGIGIELPTNGYHKGLNNMQQRANKIAGKLSIQSIRPHGTSVRLDGFVKKFRKIKKTATPENTQADEHYYENHHH